MSIQIETYICRLKPEYVSSNGHMTINQKSKKKKKKKKTAIKYNIKIVERGNHACFSKSISIR